MDQLFTRVQLLNRSASKLNAVSRLGPNSHEPDDAWVDGNEDCELLDFSGYAQYAVEKDAKKSAGINSTSRCNLGAE